MDWILHELVHQCAASYLDDSWGHYYDDRDVGGDDEPNAGLKWQIMFTIMTIACMTKWDDCHDADDVNEGALIENHSPYGRVNKIFNVNGEQWINN